MNTVKLIFAALLFICFSCSSGETDKKTEVNDSEHLDLHKDKNTTDSASVRVDSVNKW